MLETIKAEFGERSATQILTKLPLAEEVIRRKSGTTHHLWETTRMKILLAVVEGLVLPERFTGILHRTGFQEREIYPFRKTLILEGVLQNRFADRKRELVRQALQRIAEADIDHAIKGQAVRVLTQVVTLRPYVPSVKSANILAAIAVKAAAELTPQELQTSQICQAIGCSYIPHEKVRKFVGIMKTRDRGTGTVRK